MTEAEWLAATDPQQMLKFLRGKVSNRKLRLFAVECCRQIWNLISDPRSRAAVEVTERYAHGGATAAELDAAGRAAYDATRRKHEDAPRVDVRSAAFLWAVGAGYCATGVAWIARDAIWFAAKNAAEDAAHAATAGGGEAAGVVARRGQALALACVVGARQSAAVEPTWLACHDGAVEKLARAAYDDRRLPEGALDPTRLAVLADALEEAGCGEAELLGHLRGPGPHVRGCLAVD